MITENKIYQIFVEVTEENEEKELVSLQPMQTQEPIQWTLPFIFSDGTRVERRTELGNKEFRKEWKRFWHWFQRIRKAEMSEGE